MDRHVTAGKRPMRQPPRQAASASVRGEPGFSLLELVIASAVLLVGILSVVQLVPASLQSDVYNRYDTMATVVAQHQLDLMLAQPVSATTLIETVNGATQTVSLGSAGATGSPVVMQGATPVIDFSATAVDQFNIQDYYDPNDPTQSTFELRWAVLPLTKNGVLVGKRFIVGCRKTNTAHPMLPVNLDSSVQR